MRFRQQAVGGYAIIDIMAQLIVRNLEEGLVRELQRRAAEHGRSTEAEHREILREALGERRDFKAFLESMPAGGEDSDFERVRSEPRDIEL